VFSNVIYTSRHFTEMEEDRTSETVVMPDISEPLTNESDEHGVLTSESHQTVTPVAVPVASVPVSLPVGSLIGVASTGTTFNVITPDQLQVRKLRCESFVVTIFAFAGDLKRREGMLVLPMQINRLGSYHFRRG
jgi:hypothetical protein